MDYTICDESRVFYNAVGVITYYSANLDVGVVTTETNECFSFSSLDCSMPVVVGSSVMFNAIYVRNHMNLAMGVAKALRFTGV